MTALVVAAAVIAVSAIVALAVAWAHDRHRVERLTYAVQWTETDRENHLLELAVQTNRGARWHRNAKRFEQVARNQAEQLAGRRRQPIPLAPARSPFPDYGPRNR